MRMVELPVKTIARLLERTRRSSRSNARLMALPASTVLLVMIASAAARVKAWRPSRLPVLQPLTTSCTAAGLQNGVSPVLRHQLGDPGRLAYDVAGLEFAEVRLEV